MDWKQALEPHPTGLTPIPLPGLPRAGGTYGLELALAGDTQCAIGALGRWSLSAGLYLYVGSAWGPGGLGARLGRHLRGDGATRWHIDYLRALATPMTLWVAPGEHLECAWAQALGASPGVGIAVPRFGASDCHCASHLFHVEPDAHSTLALPGSPGRLSRGSDGVWH
ncbi:MAG: GIY-YIG nuclease family protein [Anaerolineae bacterium]|nr:GIY-YIG nuclease family protein [Anaerolineae bacterium]